MLSMQQVPAMHGVQLLQVCVKAEGLNVELKGRHRVLYAKCCQHIRVHDSKDANLQHKQQAHSTRGNFRVDEQEQLQWG